MISRPRIVGSVAAVFLLLAGCGQSGPLFLPEEAPAAEATGNASAAPAETPGADEGGASSDENDADDEER